MIETEPLYFKEFREHLDKKFEETKIEIKSEITKEINDLADITYNQYQEVIKRLDGHDERFEQIDSRFERIDSRFERIDSRFEQIDSRFDIIESEIYEIKNNIIKIEGHIGRYEIRAQNIEQILLQDFKPRIQALEKEVFA